MKKKTIFQKSVMLYNFLSGSLGYWVFICEYRLTSVSPLDLIFFLPETSVIFNDTETETDTKLMILNVNSISNKDHPYKC
jgi:hypothetical protein